MIDTHMFDIGWVPRTHAERVGKCYYLTTMGVAGWDVPGVVVHGTIEGFGFPPNPHAWIELADGCVFDPVAMELMTAAEWIDFATPTEWVRYTPDEVRANVELHGHTGPWDEWEAKAEPLREAMRRHVAERK